MDSILGFVYKVEVGVVVYISCVKNAVGTRRMETSQLALAEPIQFYLEHLATVSFRHKRDSVRPVIVIQIDHKRRP
ncbi:MAG: hypothetical protein DMG59_23850 [Acidobacteria bacterium]|nr:MAG: hypothetical protein DMG59_23850 [Acidobacteriota bacterium]